MNWFQGLIFGLISGLSDVTPVSSQAHKAILLKLFGENAEDPLLRLVIHVATLAALYYCCSSHIQRIIRQLRLSRVPKKRRKRPLDTRTIMEFKLLRMMVIPVLLSLFLYNKTAVWNTKLSMTTVFLLLNGVILFLPGLVATGNKDARSMSALEGLLMGLGGAVSVLPGVSAVGAANAVGSACGAERVFCLNMTYLMQMVLTVGLIALDVAAVFAANISGLTLGSLIIYLLSGIAAFVGSYIGIRGMRMIAVNIGFGIFAFYSFGAAVLSFVLFLMV